MLSLSHRTFLAALLIASSGVSAASPQAAASVSPGSAAPPQIVGSDQQQAPAIVTIASDNSPPAASAAASAPNRPSYELPPAISHQIAPDQVGGEDRPSALSNPWPARVGVAQSRARSLRQREEDSSPDRPSLTASTPPPDETHLPAERPSALSPAQVAALPPAAASRFVQPLERVLPTINAPALRPVVTVNPVPLLVSYAPDRVRLPSITVQAVARELSRVPVAMLGIDVHPTIDHVVFQPAVQVVAAVPRPVVIVPNFPPVFQHTQRDMAQIKLSPARPVVRDLPASVVSTIRAAELAPISPEASPIAAGGVIAAVSSPRPYHVQREPRRVAHLTKKPSMELASLTKQLHQLNRRLVDARHEVQEMQTQEVTQVSISARFAVRLAEKDKEIADIKEQLRLLHASS